ncbi:MAG: hypothetical protein U1E17_06075 [Geminicoccaceae bacterium]
MPLIPSISRSRTPGNCSRTDLDQRYGQHERHRGRQAQRPEPRGSPRCRAPGQRLVDALEDLGGALVERRPASVGQTPCAPRTRSATPGFASGLRLVAEARLGDVEALHAACGVEPSSTIPTK